MCDKEKKNIIILSALNIWSMGKLTGAQSLFKTLTHTSEHFNVSFISPKSSYSGYSTKDFSFKIYTFSLWGMEKIFSTKNKLNSLKYIFFPIWWLLFQIKSFILLRSIIKNQKISLLYAYEVIAVPAVKLLSFIYHIPIITRFQGTILYPHLSKPLSRITQFHHYLALKIKADAIIMTNDGTKGLDVLHSLHNTSPTYFWYNGVEPPSIPTKDEVEQLKNQLLFSENDTICLTVSRLVYWKRVDRAIQAVHDCNNKNVKLIIVGSGEDKTRLENLVQKLGLQKQVTFIGGVKHADLGKYYAISDIFLSLYSLSNVGNPLLEAMKLSKPIITLDNGDTSKLIKHKQNGYLLPEDAQEDITLSIKELIKDKEKATTLGRAAKKTADNLLDTWDERMEREISLIKELVPR